MPISQYGATLRSPRAYWILVIVLLIGSGILGCDQLQRVIESVGSEGADSGAMVKIGFIYSPPDPGTTRNGTELAVALANQAGGINGVLIELLMRDAKGDPSLSVQHAEELIAAGVSAIVGPDYSAEAVEVGKVALLHGVPMVTTYPTNPKVSQSGRFSFMGAYTDPFQAGVAAKFATQELRATTAAVLTEMGETYSEELSTAFVEHFTTRGGEIEVHQFYDTGATDFTQQLKAIAAVDPPVNVIFLAGLGSEFPVAVKQAKSSDFRIAATFLGGDGWDRPDLVDIGGMAVEGSFFVNHFSPGGDPEQLSEEAQKFVFAYTEMFGIAPDGPAALGYDSTMIAIQAMRRASDATPAAIRDEIAATQNYSGATNLSHFDENRYAIKSAVINTVKDGKIQFYQAIEP